jgi:uncharacterized membrane protein
MPRLSQPYSDMALAQSADGLPAIRRIGTSAVWRALRLGWEDFQANPTQLVFLAIIYPVIGLVAAAAAAGRDLMPLIWPLLSGFALVGPIAAIGIYEMSRRREAGLPVSWVNAFDVRHSPSLPSILALSVMLLAIFVAWLFTAEAIYRASFGQMVPMSVGDFLAQLTGTAGGRRLMVLGNAAGFVFAAVVLSLTVISFPLLLDRPVGAGAAIRASLRAVATNPAPMALWGLVVAVILLVASIPLFVGLAVAVPVLGHATWHLYRAVMPR